MSNKRKAKKQTKSLSQTLHLQTNDPQTLSVESVEATTTEIITATSTEPTPSVDSENTATTSPAQDIVIIIEAAADEDASSTPDDTWQP